MWEGFGSPYFIGMNGLSMNSVKRQQLASERIRKLETELEAVSYTHLDVYKRQTEGFTGR